MTAYVALLRAINVGGRKLIMKDLAGIGESLGFAQCRTFIASGNLLFTSPVPEADVKMKLEKALSHHMGAEVPVMVRTAAEMTAVAEANPFSDRPGNRVVAIFLNQPLRPEALKEAKNQANERLAMGKREVYIAYPSGMADSKLRIPGAEKGTARNMNSISKMAKMAREME